MYHSITNIPVEFRTTILFKLLLLSGAVPVRETVSLLARTLFKSSHMVLVSQSDISTSVSESKSTASGAFTDDKISTIHSI